MGEGPETGVFEEEVERRVVWSEGSGEESMGVFRSCC